MRVILLYVVIVETGEYSEREDWVGGVFDSRSVAEKFILEKSAAARQTELDLKFWQNNRWNICREMRGDDEIWKLNDDQLKLLEQKAGPRPDGQTGDQFYLVEVPLNEWGQFIYSGNV